MVVKHRKCWTKRTLRVWILLNIDPLYAALPVEHIFYAGISQAMRMWRIAGADMMPVSIMINLVMYIEWALIDYRKLCCIHSCLVTLSVVLYPRGQSAAEIIFKSTLITRHFGIMDGKSKGNCWINTLKWEMSLGVATDRARWKKVVRMNSIKSIVYCRKYEEH